MGRYFETETKNKKWIWFFLILAVVALMVFFLCKKTKKKKRFDTDTSEYLTTGEECIACCGNENHDTGSYTNGV